MLLKNRQALFYFPAYFHGLESEISGDFFVVSFMLDTSALPSVSFFLISHAVGFIRAEIQVIS